MRSIYCLDTPVLDQAYFREKMRESRERKRRQDERVRRDVIESRSPPISFPSPLRSDSTAGIHDAIDTFHADELQSSVQTETSEAFAFDAYRAHLRALTDGCVVDFEGVSPLIADQRMDRVFRFITAVFMDQEGTLELEQRPGGIVLVGT